LAFLRLLILLSIWMCRTATQSGPEELKFVGPAWGAAIFLGVYALTVLVMAFWARLLTRRLGSAASPRSLRRFNKVINIVRLAVPAWLAIAIFGGLQWGNSIDTIAGPLAWWPSPVAHIELPLLLAGIAPALLAWMALWWAEYPVDRVWREQNMLLQLDHDLPIHAPPSFWSFFGTNLRLQLLFMLAPFLCILLVHDLVTLLLWFLRPDIADEWANLIMLPAAAMMFILAPELLRRLLRTEPLPDVLLRTRLETLCRRTGLRYHEILLWHTNNSMGNAMVMGLFPRVRYILLSDLLLETMSDEQIEAVFAHEVGHIAHRHMWWLVAFVATFATFALGPGDLIAHGLGILRDSPHWPGLAKSAHAAHVIRFLRSLEGPIMLIVTLGLFRFLFGYYSRWLERQADVYGARLMQTAYSQPLASAHQAFGNTYVGEQGAGLFSSALRRVAFINHISTNGRNWRHGSIEKRIRYLHHLSADPQLTGQFDRFMRRLFILVVVALCTFAIWDALSNYHCIDQSILERPTLIRSNYSHS